MKTKRLRLAIGVVAHSYKPIIDIWVSTGHLSNETGETIKMCLEHIIDPSLGMLTLWEFWKEISQKEDQPSK